MANCRGDTIAKSAHHVLAKQSVQAVSQKPQVCVLNACRDSGPSFVEPPGQSVFKWLIHVNAAISEGSCRQGKLTRNSRIVAMENELSYLLLRNLPPLNDIRAEGRGRGHLGMLANDRS